MVHPPLVGHKSGELGEGLFTLVTDEPFVPLCIPSLCLLISAKVWQEKAQPWKPQFVTNLDENLVLAAVLLSVLLKTVLPLQGRITLGAVQESGLPGDLGVPPHLQGRGGGAEQVSVMARQVLHLVGQALETLLRRLAHVALVIVNILHVAAKLL